MIRCQKCNEENLLTAIFCRSCGVKLDLTSIRPQGDHFRVKEEETVVEKAGGMKRIIRMVVIGVVLFLVLGLGKKVPRGNPFDGIQSIIALLVACIVTVEMLIEAAVSGAVSRLIPWVIVLLAFATVAKANWPAAIALGVVAATAIVCDVIKHRPVIMPHTTGDSNE